MLWTPILHLNSVRTPSLMPGPSAVEPALMLMAPPMVAPGALFALNAFLVFSPRGLAIAGQDAPSERLQVQATQSRLQTALMLLGDAAKSILGPTEDHHHRLHLFQARVGNHVPAWSRRSHQIGRRAAVASEWAVRDGLARRIR